MNEYERKELIQLIKLLGIVRWLYRISTIVSVSFIVAAIITIYIQPSNLALCVGFLLVALLFVITSFILFHEFESCKNKVCRLKEEFLHNNK